MSFQALTTPLPVQTLLVYPAEMFRVTHGVNRGDAITAASDLEHEDIYELAENADQNRLALAIHEETGGFVIAAGSVLGRAGAALHLDCVATFMGPHGSTEDVLVLVEIDPNTGMIARSYLHPLTPLRSKTEYTLVTTDTSAARAKLAESACVSFTRGTNIALADGRQVPVQDLRAGDKILTKDNGAQKLRWIGMQTVRATGAFAPIVISAGALNNINDLTVSPNHRLFIYQRVDKLGAGQSEVLVKARNLINGTSVVSAEGGFVDYFQLLFDKHEIIFAEGIAAESMFIDMATRPVVPAKVQESLKSGAGPQRTGREMGAADLVAKDAVELLRRASSL